MKLDSLLRRLRSLEPTPPRITAWPPKEGSFSFWLWDAIGRPGERQSFWQMYGQRAKEVFEVQNDKN